MNRGFEVDRYGEFLGKVPEDIFNSFPSRTSAVFYSAGRKRRGQNRHWLESFRQRDSVSDFLRKNSNPRNMVMTATNSSRWATVFLVIILAGIVAMTFSRCHLDPVYPDITATIDLATP